MPRRTFCSQRILLVEDEYFLADELARVLIDAGAAVIGPVATVEGALALLKGPGVPNVALLDVNLGGEEVYPVADTLLTLGVPFLFTTGYDQAIIPSRYASARHLEKPMNAATILRELGALIESQAAQTDAIP